MNLRRAAIFVRVIEEAGVTAAARALGLPKSAVSSAISLLEEELGVRLLHRSSRKVTPTQAGASLYARAAPALAALDEASAAVADATESLSGPIRMTAPVEVGARLLEPILVRFLAEHPAVTIDLVLTARALDLVEEGIDLAVRGGPVRDGSLVARKLTAQDAGLFAAPAYLARRGQPRRLAALSEHDCVLYRPVAGRARWHLSGPGGDQSVDVSARISADHFSFIVRAVASGAGVGLLPLFLCQDEVARGEIVRVLPRYAMRGTPLRLVYPSARYLPRRVAILRDALVDGFSPRKALSLARSIS